MERTNLIILILLCIFLVNCSNSQIQEVKDSITLKQGKNPGTFEFSYTLLFSKENLPEFPIDVYIVPKNNRKNEIIHFKVESEQNNIITVDLKPGEYMILGKVINKKEKFRDAEGTEFKIDKLGNSEISNFPLVFHQKIEILSPKIGQHFEIERNIPCLKWIPIKEATCYSVEWEEFVENSNEENRVLKNDKIMNIKDSSICFHFLKSKKSFYIDTSIIQWELVAYNNYGFVLGRESGSFVVKY